MTYTVHTMTNHTTDVSGGVLAAHCCGCWNVVLDEEDPFRPKAICNECKEERTFAIGGIK